SRYLRRCRLRARTELRFLRLAVRLLDRRAGRAHGLRADHRHLRLGDEPARSRVRRRRRGGRMSRARQRAFTAQLWRVYTLYTIGFVFFVVALAIFEQMGMARTTMGYVFLAATILVYAGIGIISRTNDPTEYYVAGRRVPAIFNGMATGADWMSAASFISLAGGLYAGGYSGLAFIMGWTGGYVLVALLLAPYLRKFG